MLYGLTSSSEVIDLWTQFSWCSFLQAMEEVHRILVEVKGEGEIGRGLPAAAQGRLGPGKGKSINSFPCNSASADWTFQASGLSPRTSLGEPRRALLRSATPNGSSTTNKSTPLPLSCIQFLRPRPQQSWSAFSGRRDELVETDFSFPSRRASKPLKSSPIVEYPITSFALSCVLNLSKVKLRSFF